MCVHVCVCDVGVYFYYRLPEVHLNASDLIPASFGTFRAMETGLVSPDKVPQPLSSCVEAAARVTGRSNIICSV